MHNSGNLDPFWLILSALPVTNKKRRSSWWLYPLPLDVVLTGVCRLTRNSLVPVLKSRATAPMLKLVVE